MKKPTEGPSLQLNLPLPNGPSATIPDGKQRELVLALIELLIGGFRQASPALGGGDEPEAHC